MLKKVVGTDDRQRKMVLATKRYGLWQGLYYLVLNSGAGNRRHLLCREQMAVSYTALDKARKLSGVLWSPWGLTGAHSPTQPRTQGREETEGVWGSFKLGVSLPNLGEPRASSHHGLPAG